eukprot:11166675-Heterocapsa_arctica.AAC.1
MSARMILYVTISHGGGITTITRWLMSALARCTSLPKDDLLERIVPVRDGSAIIDAYFFF